LSAWPGVLVVALTGVALWSLLGPPKEFVLTLALAPMLGIAATAAWMGILQVIHVAWSPVTLLLLPAATLVAFLMGPRRMPQPTKLDRWSLAALGVAVAHMTVLAAVPSFGWDFRYDWGLKAQVFAAAGRHDGTWLASPAHAFVHPAYPPLWSDLLAHSVLLGGTASGVAAVWQAVLAGGLAAACWSLAKPAPRWVRALASACGAWPMVLFWPRYSGFAEPLVAYLLAAALLATKHTRPKVMVLVAAMAVACLALSKQEGMALGLGVVLAVWIARPRRGAALIAAAWVAAVAGWQVFLAFHGIRFAEYDLHLSRILTHVLAFGPSLLAASKPKYILVLGVWAVTALGLRRGGTAGLRPVLALWAVAVVGAYLTTTADLTWHLFTSLDRVLAVPLPASLALVIGAHFNQQRHDPAVLSRSGT
jgi:hypothetical protein